MEDDHPTQPRGLRDSARAAVGSSVEFVRARGELLTLEAEEAKNSVRVIARFALFGIILFATGYGLGVTLLALLAARTWFDGDPLIPLIGAAALHLFAGGVLLVATRARSKRAEPFSESIDQFERDREWLRQIQDELTSEH